MSKNFFYNLLHNIEGRCTNPNVNKYEYYGGRGIKNRLTRSDLEFLFERDNAVAMQTPSIDRIDSSGDYTLDNCRFIEFDENRRQRQAGAPQRQCTKCSELFPARIHDLCPRCRLEIRRTRICVNCRQSFVMQSKVRRRCPACDNETRPCAFCGTLITRSWSQQETLARNKLWFCNKKEQGKWLSSQNH